MSILFGLPGCRDKTDNHVANISKLVHDKDFDGLLELTRSDDAELKCRAARTLSWVRAPEAAEAHAALLTLEGCQWNIPVEAAWRLMEEDATDKLPDVIAQLGAKDRKMRWNIAKVLAKWEKPEALPHVQKCMADPDAFVAAWCGWSVCELTGGPDCPTPNMDLRDGMRGPFADGLTLEQAFPKAKK